MTCLFVRFLEDGTWAGDTGRGVRRVAHQGASGSWWPWPRLCPELGTQDLAENTLICAEKVRPQLLSLRHIEFILITFLDFIAPDWPAPFPLVLYLHGMKYSAHIDRYSSIRGASQNRISGRAKRAL